MSNFSEDRTAVRGIRLVTRLPVAVAQICDSVHKVGGSAVIMACGLHAQIEIYVLGLRTRTELLPDISDLQSLEVLHSGVIQHPRVQEEVREAEVDTPQLQGPGQMRVSLFCLQPALAQIVTVGAEFCPLGNSKGRVPQVVGSSLGSSPTAADRWVSARVRASTRCSRV